MRCSPNGEAIDSMEASMRGFFERECSHLNDGMPVAPSHSDAALADTLPPTRAASSAASAASRQPDRAIYLVIASHRPLQRPALHDQKTLPTRLYYRSIRQL